MPKTQGTNAPSSPSETHGHTQKMSTFKKSSWPF